MKTKSGYSSILYYELNIGDEVIISYYNDEHQAKHIDGVLKQIIRKGDSGILCLEDGIEILIDKIISVNGDISPNYADELDGCSCK